MGDVNDPTVPKPGSEPGATPQGSEPNEPVVPATPPATPPVAPAAPAGGEPPAGGKPPVEGTPPATPPAASATPPATPPAEPGQTVPYSRFKQINEAYKKSRRELAQLRGQSYLDQHGQPTGGQPQGKGTTEEIRNHPYVQGLEMKQAEADLRRGAEEMLQNYPQLPKHVKKAIIKNPRGFVQPATEDIQNGLIDIEDYVQDLVATIEGESGQPVTPKKQVPVAGTNTPAATQGGTTPADIQKILDKPPTEYTKEDIAKLEEAGAPKL